MTDTSDGSTSDGSEADAKSDTETENGADATHGIEPIAGIGAVGAYAPRLRIDVERIADSLGTGTPAGIDTTAVPEADEDALTMAVAAARRCLDATSRSADDLAALGFASTTPPLDEEELTARLGSALGVPETASRRQFLGTTRGGTVALRALADTTPALVVAGDCPRGAPTDERDHAAGAGAVAVLLEPPADAPAVVTEAAEYVDTYPGTRFRERGEARIDGLGVTSYDRSAYREPIREAVEILGDHPDADAVAIQAPDGELPYRIADTIGVDAEAIARCAHVDDLGDTGAASALLSLAVALDDGASSVLCIGYGSGAGADALVVERTGTVPSTIDLDGGEAVERAAVTYPEYLRRRGNLSESPPEGGGAYVSVPTWRRSIPQRHRLVAGRCSDCGELAFPPRGACRVCSSREGYDPVELPGTGTVETVTTIEQGGAPPEFAEQQSRSGAFPVAIVAFDGPGRDPDTVSVPVQITDVDPESVEIGQRVRATFRRIYTQEGVPRYGTKVRFAPE